MSSISLDQLSSIIVRAATLEEREGPAFQVQATEPGTLENRLSAAIQLSSGGDEPLFQQLLELRGIDVESYKDGLKEAEILAQGELPDWAMQLAAWHQTPDWDKDALLREARDLLEKWCDAVPGEVDEHVAESFVSALTNRVELLLGQGLANHLTDAGLRLEGRVLWWEAFARYPVFARLVARAFLSWKFATSQFFLRLARDYQLLEKTFGSAEGMGRLSEVRGAEQGDTHHHGQKVLMLRFQRGAEIVYKPRDLRIAEHYLQMERTISAEGFGMDFFPRKFLGRDGYAWEDKLRPEACRSTEEVERFFVRLGAMTRLFEPLNSRDLHRENILAVGEYPVVIDLETVIHPFLSQNSHVDLSTMAFLTAPHFGDTGCRPLDLGVLAGSRPQTIPNRSRPDLILQPVPCLPSLDGGEPVCGTRYAEQVEDGYLQMDEWLSRNGADMLGPLVQRLPGTVFRSLYRSTDHYDRLLKLSLRPELLKYGWMREAYLEKLYRAAVRWGHTPSIASNEIAGLRRLDFPTFTGRLDEEGLIGEDGSIAQDFFAPGLTDKIVAALERPGTGASVKELRTILALAPLQASPLWSFSSSGLKVDYDRELSALAEFLCEAAADRSRVSTKYVPWADRWIFGRMSPDLLSGSAGLALVCAELAIGLGSPECEVATELFLEDVKEFLEDSSEKFRKVRRGAQEKFFCGYFHGFGGAIYALLQCGRLLKRPAWQQIGSTQLLEFPVELALERTSSDYIVGTDGLALALMSLSKEEPELEARVTQLLDSTSPPDLSSFPPDSRTLPALPSPGAVRELLRFRQGKASGRIDLEDPGWSLVALELAPSHRDSMAEGFDALGQLKFLLGAHRAWGEERFLARGAEMAGSLLSERGKLGRWPTGWKASDQHHLCGVTGIGAVALLLLYLARRKGPVALDIPK